MKDYESGTKSPRGSTTAIDASKAIQILTSTEKESSHARSSTPVANSPATDSGESKISVRDKIATFKAASTTAPTHESAPETRKSEGTSKIAALAGAVNVAALGSPGLVQKKPSTTDTVSAPDMNRTLNENETQRTEPTPLNNTNSVSAAQKPVETVDEKTTSNPRHSSRIAELGGLVNVAALGPRPIAPVKPVAKVEIVDERPVPVVQSASISSALPENVDEESTSNADQTSLSTNPVPESGNNPSDATSNGPPKAEGEEEEPDVFADPTIMYSKKVSSLLSIIGSI